MTGLQVPFFEDDMSPSFLLYVIIYLAPKDLVLERIWSIVKERQGPLPYKASIYYTDMKTTCCLSFKVSFNIHFM
jgi:hypothetical protein